MEEGLLMSENREVITTSPALTAGAEGKLLGPEEPASYEDESRRFEQMQDRQLGETGEVDAAAFVKAQSEFLRVQTWFLTHGKEPGSLVKYSLAQGAFIEAQRRMLEQLGVV
jgi:hypothetical protein